MCAALCRDVVVKGGMEWQMPLARYCSLVGGVLLARWLDPTFGPRALVGLALGTLIGGFLQLAVT